MPIILAKTKGCFSCRVLISYLLLKLIIIFVIGETSEQAILSGVIEENADKNSIFCLGFGNDLNHNFLNRISTENRGIYR